MKTTINIILLSLLTLFLASAPSCRETSIKKGDTVGIPLRMLVDVKNLDPIKSGESSFKYDDSCVIEEDETLTVVGIEEDRLLVRYSTDDIWRGLSCPTGTLFFTTRKVFSEMIAEYRQINKQREKEKKQKEKEKKEKQEEKDLVRRLLSES